MQVIEAAFNSARRISFKILLSLFVVFWIFGIAWGIDNPDVTPFGSRPEIFPFNFGMWLIDVGVSGFQELVGIALDWVTGLFSGGN